VEVPDEERVPGYPAVGRSKMLGNRVAFGMLLPGLFIDFYQCLLCHHLILVFFDGFDDSLLFADWFLVGCQGGVLVL